MSAPPVVTTATVVFSLKTFLAAMLAYFIAIRFDLPRPFWAVATVYLVAAWPKTEIGQYLHAVAVSNVTLVGADCVEKSAAILGAGSDGLSVEIPSISARRNRHLGGIPRKFEEYSSPSGAKATSISVRLDFFQHNRRWAEDGAARLRTC